MPDQSLALLEAQVPSAEAMSQMLAVAKALVDARMVPAGITKAGQALALILTGREMGIGPLRSLQDLYPVKGNVGMMTKFMVAQFRLAGHCHDILVKTPEHCKVILHLKEGRDLVVEFTRDEVNALGYPYFWKKDEQGRAKKYEKPQWKGNPAGMLYNRTMTKAIRTHAPEVLYGMLTQEEIQDRGVAAGESHLVGFLKESHPEVWAEYQDSLVQDIPHVQSEPSAPGNVVNGESRELPSDKPPGDDGQSESGSTTQTQEHWTEAHTKDGRSVRDIFWTWAHEEKTLTDDQVYTALGTRNELEFPPMQETKNRIQSYIMEQLALAQEAKAKKGQPLAQERIPFL